MTLGRIVHLLPQDERKTVRRLEKLAYKINAAETAAIFNETCIQEGLLPRYIYTSWYTRLCRVKKSRKKYKNVLLVPRRRLLSPVATHCHPLYPVITYCYPLPQRSHLLTPVRTRYYPFSPVVTRYHSLGLLKWGILPLSAPRKGRFTGN